MSTQAHNLTVVGSNPTPATSFEGGNMRSGPLFLLPLTGLTGLAGLSFSADECLTATCEAPAAILRILLILSKKKDDKEIFYH